MLAGCGSPAQGDESIESGEIGSSPALLGTVSGSGLTDQHLNFRAAESVLSTISPTSLRHVATYNAVDSPPNLVYTNTTRTIRRNTSLMGWANWRLTDGVITNEGRVRPPPGWAVLWGDPAIARNSGNSNLLYIANLGIPNLKFPTSEMIEGPVDPAGLPASFCGSFLGGACIARSTNDGQSFTVSASDCLQRTDSTCPGGHFYDGGSLASSGSGRMFAAFNDVTTSRHDVYQAQSMTGSFQRISDFGIAVSLHPRIRWGARFPTGTDSTGALYMLYVTTALQLGIARYDGGGNLTGPWTIASWSSNVFPTFNNVNLADRFIRLGPEYDFDIGFNESGVREIRIVYSVADGNGRIHMNGASCTVNFPNFTCAPKGALWSTSAMFSTTHQWNSHIAFGQTPNGANTWQVSFYNSVMGTNNVELWKMKLSNAGMGPVTRQETAQVACPDLRGYWGDYDNVVPSFGQFLRLFTDSSHSSCVQQQFTANPMFASVAGWVPN
jgi:hypothetical protein